MNSGINFKIRDFQECISDLFLYICCDAKRGCMKDKDLSSDIPATVWLIPLFGIVMLVGAILILLSIIIIICGPLLAFLM